MLRYRTFSNLDPPVLAAIWRSRAGQRGLTQPISVDLLEQFVFGKIHFDYDGLILAVEDERPVGFAHAAFGPNSRRDWFSTGQGITCLVVVRPDCDEAPVASGLLERSEAYLKGRGAEVLFGGAAHTMFPFYLGLHGGSEPTGVLDSDTVARQAYLARGYEEVGRILCFRRPLGAFRPPTDRRQLQLRRQTIVHVKMDPPSRDWWEACTTGDFDLTRFELLPRGGGEPLAWATFWGMEIAGFGPVRAQGLLDVHVDPKHRRQGMATFLMGEAFRQLAQLGVAEVEGQTAEQNQPCAGLFRKLGMEPSQHGGVFRKKVDGQ